VIFQSLCTACIAFLNVTPCSLAVYVPKPGTNYSTRGYPVVGTVGSSVTSVPGSLYSTPSRLRHSAYQTARRYILEDNKSRPQSCSLLAPCGLPSYLYVSLRGPLAGARSIFSKELGHARGHVDRSCHLANNSHHERVTLTTPRRIVPGHQCQSSNAPDVLGARFSQRSL
jgi:hypothetical protein